jgi:putative RNA 2'-phosphotransferase
MTRNPETADSRTDPRGDVGLSKLMSLILRHRPGDFGLALDPEGFVPLEDLLSAVREEAGRGGVTADDIRRVTAGSDKKRFEIAGDRIRACYGHTVAASVAYEVATPPAVLWHGTPRTAEPAIRREGLRPMSRQYVHLSATREIALRVGRRRDPSPVILTVRTSDAHAAGIVFHRANDLIWLVKALPPEFLE